MNIKIKIFSEHYVPPVRTSEEAAGLDLHCPYNLTLMPNKSHLIPMGFAVEIPPNFFIKLASRSGFALRGIIVLGGVIDSDFRGQVLLLLHNLRSIPVTVKVGDRIAQALILKSYKFPLVHVNELSITARGEKGMGSSGE